MELDFSKAMYVTWSVLAGIAVMIMILNSRITETQEMLKFINSDSLVKIQDDIRVANGNIIATNDNVVATNDNIEILQYNLFDKINSTCVGD